MQNISSHAPRVQSIRPFQDYACHLHGATFGRVRLITDCWNSASNVSEILLHLKGWSAKLPSNCINWSRKYQKFCYLLKFWCGNWSKRCYLWRGCETIAKVSTISQQWFNVLKIAKIWKFYLGLGWRPYIELYCSSDGWLIVGSVFRQINRDSLKFFYTFPHFSSKQHLIPRPSQIRKC